MDFALTEEQRMLQDSVSGYLGSACPLDVVREAAEQGLTHNAQLAQGLNELGVNAILIAEEYGWRVAFYAVGIPGLILAVVMGLTLREPERGEADRQGQGRAGRTRRGWAGREAARRRGPELHRIQLHAFAGLRLRPSVRAIRMSGPGWRK